MRAGFGLVGTATPEHLRFAAQLSTEHIEIITNDSLDFLPTPVATSSHCPAPFLLVDPKLTQ